LTVSTEPKDEGSDRSDEGDVVRGDDDGSTFDEVGGETSADEKTREEGSVELVDF